MTMMMTTSNTLGLAQLNTEARRLRALKSQTDERLRDLAAKRKAATQAVARAEPGARKELKGVCSQEKALRFDRANLVRSQQDLDARRDKVRGALAARAKANGHF